MYKEKHFLKFDKTMGNLCLCLQPHTFLCLSVALCE